MIDISRNRRFPLLRDRCARILEQITDMETETGAQCHEWEFDPEVSDMISRLAARLSEMVQ